MTRVSRIVYVMMEMEDETVFPFKSLTVEPGKSWRAKAFKNAGKRALGRSAFHGLGHNEPWYLVTNYPHMRGTKVWDEHVGGVDVYGLQIGRLAVAEEPGAESGARGHTVAGDVGCVRADAESRREGPPVAEDSSRGGRRESER